MRHHHRSVGTRRLADPCRGAAGSSFDEAPEWDPDDCVIGVAGTAGEEWTFAVGGIEHRFGVALVPAPDVPAEFQIAFRVRA